MINKITLRDVSSYSPDSDVEINSLKRVNIFYGQNGAGKSTIGCFLQDPNKSIYKKCSVAPVNTGREVFVYNNIFMEKNFHEVASQPGVFTLNKENVDAEKSITLAESELIKLNANFAQSRDKEKKAKSAQDRARENIKDNVWKSKSTIEGTDLDYCLNRLNTKERFLEAVCKKELIETEDTIASLNAEAKKLLIAGDTEIPRISNLFFNASDIETDEIFEEAIVGLGDSYLSELIQKLGHSDWVKNALNFEENEIEKCPLCQQKLPEDFYKEVRKVFDETYDKKINQLVILRKKYSDSADYFIGELSKPPSDIALFKGEVDKLRNIFYKNIDLILRKISNPSIKLTLENTSESIKSINDLIDEEQNKIDEINSKIKRKQESLEEIKERLFSFFRNKCDQFFVVFHEELELQKNILKDVEEEIKNTNIEISKQKKIIEESRAATTNVDQSVENINNWLGFLGLKGFEIIKEEGDIPQYRLTRSKQRDGVFKTLSEGEKTLISFLYFLELCNGELNAAGGGPKSERVVVIDDPISSLSHNYVYDIASLILRHVLQPHTRFKQIIILTHNLFFFHEMHKLLKEGKEASLALFRIAKADYSTVVSMKDNEILNDYQALWQSLKDAISGKASPSIIPNVMRNILEHYFTFVHQKESLRKSLMELSEENPQFRALYRYINRESHADSVNLTDFGEIDAGIFIERFKEVFIKTKFEAHFEKMMN